MINHAMIEHALIFDKTKASKVPIVELWEAYLRLVRLNVSAVKC